MLVARWLGRWWLPLAVVVGTLAIVGCGSDAQPNTSKSEVKNAAPRPTENPEASSDLIAALRASERGSPKRAIFSLYYYARWGNFPSLVRLYDPKVRSTIGRSRIASVYSDNRGRFLSVGVPKIVDTRYGAEGLSVAVELRSTEGSLIQESYLMRRRQGTWRIGYDTFFDRAYGEAARVAIDGADKPSAAGTRAARRSSERFRSLFLGD